MKEKLRRMAGNRRPLSLLIAVATPLALPAMLAAENGSTAGSESVWPVASFTAIVMTLLAVGGLAWRAGRWQQKVDTEIANLTATVNASVQSSQETRDAATALATTVAKGAEARQEIRAAVDHLGERFKTGDAARQQIREAVDRLGERFENGDAARRGIQATLDRVARALNPAGNRADGT